MRKLFVVLMVVTMCASAHAVTIIKQLKYNELVVNNKKLSISLVQCEYDRKAESENAVIILHNANVLLSAETNINKVLFTFNDTSTTGLELEDGGHIFLNKIIEPRNSFDVLTDLIKNIERRNDFLRLQIFIGPGEYVICDNMIQDGVIWISSKLPDKTKETIVYLRNSDHQKSMIEARANRDLGLLVNEDRSAR